MSISVIKGYLETAKATIAPYLMLIKIGLLVALFAFGWVTSCSHYKKADSAVDTEQATDLATCRKANYDYAQADLARAAQVKREQEEQAKQEAALQAAAEAARARAKGLAERLAAIEAKQEAAKKNPKCAELMEQEVCPVLR